MYNIPLDWYVSPISKKPLTLINENLLKDDDGNEFRREEKFGYWNFIPNSSPVYTEQEWESWKKLIENFMVSFENDPEHNVSYDVRDDALLFGEFCNYHGKVLDLGCGPHACPSYIKFKRNEEAEYYGLDPVPGAQPREYDFIQGIGEHVPFAEDIFDMTIYATSLLHFIDPRVGIREALRVTKPDGYLAVWVGEKTEQEIKKPVASNPWYDELEIPDGADNVFHYKRFSGLDFEKYVGDCGAKVLEKETHDVPGWGKNIFYKVQK